ncbi:hypothetical protein AOQ73_24375 [Bradyrhizobium pachyrhizi]|nr:hypothetical protein AOQ73_24375 [Bradyrhizobium pachyrhizi]
MKFSEIQKTCDGETLVVKCLNPDIARGEFLTTLRPSGSGKKTPLMMLAGFGVPTQVAGAGNMQALAIYVEAASRAQVAEVIHLGDHVRTRVSVCGHDDFVIKLLNSEGAVQPEPGTTITIGWKTEDCRALDAP